ncbi:MAG: TPM domain-containing protein [Lachnospiraceae bacterium]|nr:TPM domain-containing protein [Lachnospiraceae bacterium]
MRDPGTYCIVRLAILRKMFSFLLIALLCFAIIPNKALATDGEPHPVYKNPDTGYQVILDDQADLLTPTQEEMLLSDMKPITVYGSVAFVSVDDNSHSTSNFARDYYYDQFGSESGTIFLIDMDNRNIYIFSHGAVYQTITDTKADVITDNVYRHASDGDYFGCAKEAYHQIYTLLEGGHIAQPMKYISNALLALILAFLIHFGIVILVSGSHRASTKSILRSAKTSFHNTTPNIIFQHETSRYDPVESSSSGGSSGGSRSSGGGGGGGGGHSF